MYAEQIFLNKNRLGDEIMIYIKNIFDKITLQEYNCAKGKRYFDFIRKQFVNITPEETVRQKMLCFIQNNMTVPIERIYVEEHLAHYGISDFNGRMDIVIKYLNEEGLEKVLAIVECKKESIFIESAQVINQAENYSYCVNARYYILVNGINLRFYCLTEKGTYNAIAGVLNYDEMLKSKYEYINNNLNFQRLNYSDYFNLDTLKRFDWFSDKIGEDTPKSHVPFIMNLDDCFLDDNVRLPYLSNKRFHLIDDLGVQFRQYDDASGGGFGAGFYRVFFIEDLELKINFLCGFTIMTTRKTSNDPKYGNRNGQSVLVIIYNDGNTDEMSVQINLNKFLSINQEKRIACLYHNGAVTRKGANKLDLFKYISEYNSKLIKNEKVQLGRMDYSVPLTLENKDVIETVSNLVEYAVYRDEYKAKLKK